MLEFFKIINLALGCHHNQVAYTLNNSLVPHLCTSSEPNSCPIGFFCQFSDQNKQFQCCGIKAGKFFKVFFYFGSK